MSMTERIINGLKTTEDIINALISDRLDYLAYDDGLNMSQDIKDAIDTIQSLSAKLSASNLNNGWIKCSDALPEQPKENPLFENRPLELYLVSVINADYVFRAFWNGENFTDGWKVLEVTAWQPLPEPLKE